MLFVPHFQLSFGKSLTRRLLTYFFEEIYNSKHPFPEDELPAQFEQCTFDECQMANIDLKTCVFIDCSVLNCELSMANLDRVSFKKVEFKGCKLIGLRWDYCRPELLKFSLEDCILDYSSFARMNLTEVSMIGCRCYEVDFTETRLLKAALRKCNFERAVFDQTDLREADFTDSVHMVINPAYNNIRKAIFDRSALPGLLAQYDLQIND